MTRVYMREVDEVLWEPLESILGPEYAGMGRDTVISCRLYHPDGREVTAEDPLVWTFVFRAERVPQSNDDGEGDCG